MGFPGGSDGKESSWYVGDLGWDDPMEKGTVYLLQYSGLENSMDSMGSQRVGHDLVTEQQQHQGELNLDHCPETCIETGCFSQFSEHVMALESLTHG